MFLRKLFTAGLFLLAGFVVPVFGIAPPAQPRLAQATSDLKPDPVAQFGQLPNGLRYVVVPNKEPKARASLRLLVMAGAFQENEEQRGLAHFLEHMAFNGSTHYPAGTLVEYFQRLGMSFGGDTNASTSFEHTVYLIELPDTQAKTIEDGFKVFADFAGGLSIGPKEIEKERGIILSEKRTSDSVEYRQFVAEFEFLLGTTLLPKRMPIGLAPVIEKAQRPLFVDFYDAWYRPERMAVLAVGDFDGAEVEKQITAAFGTLKARAAKRSDPDLGPIASFKGTRVSYHAEPEAAATSVAIQTITPYHYEPDTAAKRVSDLSRQLALAMVNRRMAILSKKEGAPFSQGSASVNESYDYFLNASVQLVCKPEQWQAALGVADQELRRALEFGFQPAELREAVANTLNELEQAVKTAPTRHSDEIAGELVQALVDGKVYTSAADDLALFKPALEKINVETCLAALREPFKTAYRFVSVMGNARIDASTTSELAPAKTERSAALTPEAQILSTYEKAHAVVVTPSEQLEDSAFAYTDFGPTGKIAENKHVDDLDLTLLSFANGVRVNLKKTDFEAGQIQFSVRVGTGQLTEPKEKQGLGLFSSSTLSSGGLGKHSLDDLQRIFAGKTVGLGFRVTSDALIFSGVTNRDDLLLQLQLVAAYLVDPGYRPEASRTAQKRFDQLYTQLEHTTDGPLQLEIPRLLANADPRFGLPPREALMGRTLEEERAWLTPQFQSGAIEVGIVGDLDPTATIEFLAKTMGALPARQPKPPLEAERKVSFPDKTFTKAYTVPTAIPKGAVALYWPTTDARDIRIVRRLHMLADVLSDRLRVKVREELGDAYSPDAGSAPSETYRDYGFLYTLLTVDPEKTSKIEEAVVQIADDLAHTGVTEDELARAKNPVLTALRESSRTNSYWLSAVLASAQEFPQRLDWCRTRYADNEAISKGDLDQLAKKYFGPDRAFKVIVTPAKKTE